MVYYPPCPTPLRLSKKRQRGVLNVYTKKLLLTPPSRGDLERLRSLTELRERTDSDAIGDNNPTMRVLTGKTTTAASSTSAFLRVRILPSGPWEFSRTFPLKLPRPADWGRDPSSAGEASRGFRELFVVHSLKVNISTALTLEQEAPGYLDVDVKPFCGRPHVQIGFQVG